MNRQEIIDIAIEAGFRAPTPSDGCMGLAFDFRDGTDTGASLEKFAALVAAKERNACAKVCDVAAMCCTGLASRVAADIAEAIRDRGKS